MYLSDTSYLICANDNTKVYTIDLNNLLMNEVVTSTDRLEEINGIYHDGDIYKIINKNEYFLNNSKQYYSLFYNFDSDKKSITYIHDTDVKYIVCYSQSDLYVFNDKALGTYDIHGNLYVFLVDTDNNKYYLDLGKSKIIDIKSFSNKVKIIYDSNDLTNEIIVKLC